MFYTTLNKIRAHAICTNSLAKLLCYLGKTKTDDEPLALSTILDSNGLDTALWCLRGVDGHQREMRLYSVWSARQMQHLMTDSRSLAALDVAERHAYGQATNDELEAARNAAWDAAKNATWDVAACATWPAASDAAWGVVWAASSIAERDAQEAEFRRVFCGFAAKADVENTTSLQSTVLDEANNGN